MLSLENVLSLARPSRLFAQSAAKQSPTSADLGVTFLNVAQDSGLNAKTIFGGEHKNKYLLETTGCGVAFYDYDNDGWLDIFLVNGSRLEGFPKGEEPFSHLFKNNRDGTFTDVTLKAGLNHTGWGQGVCVGDYDNDGFEDLFVTYFGKNEAANETYRRFRDHLKENGVDLAKTNFTMGHELKFDSKTETIVGDAAASKLLTREYRKPYVVPETV